MSSDRIEDIAANWLAREDRGLSHEEAQALSLWLAQASLHRVAYLRLKAAWQRADRLSALKTPSGPAVRLARGFARPLLWSALAASLLLAMAGGTWLALRRPAQVFATPVGKTQAVRLADGSRMELNTDTRVRADVTKARRIVTLDAGEAYFDVVHDETRPFTVYAGNRRITDLGTKFTVFRDGDDVRVTVREGRVKVDMLNRKALDTPVLADAGQVVVSRGGETLLMDKSEQDISRDLSWRDGMLVFNQQTLVEVAEQFNRYNARKIQVDGSARKIRIGGSFRADNVDVFVLLLHRGFGLSVKAQGEKILVSR